MIKKQKQNIIDFIRRVNLDIESFVKNSISASTDIKKWRGLYSEFKPVRCWKLKKCGKSDCPAFKNEDYHCWLRAGTLCGGELQGEFAKKYKSCSECDVFKSAYKEPLRALYENINVLIFHLQDKVTKFKDIAIRDYLTGLYNRHFFNEVIEREIASVERRDEPLSFIMIDMDNFKKINDTQGHLTGDRLLIEAARLIKNTVRKADLVFRYGGDEFLVLLMKADCEKTGFMIERLSKAVGKWNNEKAEKFGCTMSFSIGCSTFEKGSDMNSALMKADERMYQEKKKKFNV
jgi:diguanylate cyclase (GGDEF)-like protein